MGRSSRFVRSSQWSNAEERKVIEMHTPWNSLFYGPLRLYARPHHHLWEQPRGKQTELQAIRISSNTQEGKVFQITPIFSQGSWRTLGDAESPQIQKGHAKEQWQCRCGAVPPLPGSPSTLGWSGPDSTPTQGFQTQTVKLNNQQH